MGIILQNVGIFEEKFGGDKWGFLIVEMGILTQKILATLIPGFLEDYRERERSLVDSFGSSRGRR